MLKIKKNKYSLYTKNLPKGCKLCKKGKKLVIYVTGICPRDCFYCPLSDNRKNKDIVWANEWKIKEDKDIITEAKLINAKGAGITGGDPLLKLERTIKYIKLLKKNFGKKFHIHLYTSLDLITKENLKKLEIAGLDEIRFHPDLYDEKLWNKLKILKELKIDKGIEIPIIPNIKKNIIKLLKKYETFIDFVNLNELEISDNNSNSLIKKGFYPKENSYAIINSKETALEILKELAKINYKPKIHFCSTEVKDKEQLSERIKRRAKNFSEKYDKITKEGLLIRGAIYPIITPSYSYKKEIEKLRNETNINKLKKITSEIKNKFKIKKDMIKIDTKKMRILTSIKLIKKIKTPYKKAIITEYPTEDQTEIEIEFLN